MNQCELTFSIIKTDKRYIDKKNSYMSECITKATIQFFCVDFKIFSHLYLMEYLLLANYKLPIIHCVMHSTDQHLIKIHIIVLCLKWVS
ncbi:hypothetical protein HZS_2055 [Henneguya salminicola]|nr:hypothetical protein HZS_2055 [Henneguya salminicola]